MMRRSRAAAQVVIMAIAVASMLSFHFDFRRRRIKRWSNDGVTATDIPLVVVSNASTSDVDGGDDAVVADDGMSAASASVDGDARDEPDVADGAPGLTVELSAEQPEHRCTASWDDLHLSPRNSTSTSTSTSGRTFTCGHSEGHFLAHSVFPDFDGPYPWEPDAPPPVRHDVLIYGAHGPCPSPAHTFPGKILYYNGESRGVSRAGLPCKDFVLGPKLADEKHGIETGMIYVPYVSIVMGGQYRVNRPEIFDASRRRRNSGDFFMIYAASNCVGFRDTAALSFARVGGLHLGGRCLQKNSGQLGIEQAPDSKKNRKWYDNVDFFHRYRFALVLENAKEYGYITEKIMNAFLAGSIPIWYGTADVFDIFNEKAFVYYDVNNPTVALDLVKSLEENRTKYDEMLAQPILADGNQTIEKYFSFDDDVGNGKLRKLIRQMMGLV